MSDIIISAKDIEVQFRVRDNYLTAIRNVSLDLYEGETFAIVGESGSGKSGLPKPSRACWNPTEKSQTVPLCITVRT